MYVLNYFILKCAAVPSFLQTTNTLIETPSVSNYVEHPIKFQTVFDCYYHMQNSFLIFRSCALVSETFASLHQLNPALIKSMFMILQVFSGIALVYTLKEDTVQEIVWPFMFFQTRYKKAYHIA